MKNLLLLLAVMLLFSCQNVSETERPGDLIPEQKLVEVLTDLSLINSAKNYNRRMLEGTGLRPKEFLYQKHNIDSLQLARSTQYYADHPAQLERIYDDVQNNLEELKDSLEIIREEEERVKDSLQIIEKDYDSLGVDPAKLEKKIDSLGVVRQYKREYDN